MQATYSRSLIRVSLVPQRRFNYQRFCVRTLIHLPQAALYSNESKIWLRAFFPWGPTCIHSNSFAINLYNSIQLEMNSWELCVFRMLIVFMWHDAIKPCKVIWTESVPIQRKPQYQVASFFWCNLLSFLSVYHCWSVKYGIVSVLSGWSCCIVQCPCCATTNVLPGIWLLEYFNPFVSRHSPLK
jgi:hypothetical protein